MSLIPCAGFNHADLRRVRDFSDMDFVEQEDKMCACLEACAGNPDVTAMLNEKLCKLWRMRDGGRCRAKWLFVGRMPSGAFLPIRRE